MDQPNSARKYNIQIIPYRKYIQVTLISEAYVAREGYMKIPKYSVYCAKHPEGKVRREATVIIKSRSQQNELPKYSKTHLQASSVDCQQIIDDAV